PTVLRDPSCGGDLRAAASCRDEEREGTSIAGQEREPSGTERGVERSVATEAGKHRVAVAVARIDRVADDDGPVVAAEHQRSDFKRGMAWRRELGDAVNAERWVSRSIRQETEHRSFPRGEPVGDDPTLRVDGDPACGRACVQGDGGDASGPEVR